MNIYVEPARKEDFLHPYLYVEDSDGNEEPSWMFLDTLLGAEACPFSAVNECMEKFGYKLFLVEASTGFHKDIIAAKELTADDIKEDYAKYLLANNVVVTEVKNLK